MIKKDRKPGYTIVEHWNDPPATLMYKAVRDGEVPLKEIRSSVISVVSDTPEEALSMFSTMVRILAARELE